MIINLLIIIQEKMKKILIFMDENQLKPVGGPTGYVYSIYNYMNGKRIFRNIEISFINNNSLYAKAKKLVPKFIIKLRNKNRYLNMARRIVYGSGYYTNINLNSYDFIHFHSTYDMYMIKDSLESYKGKVLLNSHSPKALHKEFLEENISFLQYSENKDWIEKIEKMDCYAFSRADYIIFPCEDAEEPYYHSWDKYKKVHADNKEKYRYITTGTEKRTPRNTAIEVRNRYGIPNDAILVCFVGRHNETKGYDQLKLIGQKLFDRHNNLYIICAGYESPIKGLNHKRWIECGWTDNAPSIINASDIFILPNKETYFDLIMLEALSLGKIVLASETGGNKYFKRYSDYGLFLYPYDDIDDAVNKVEKIMQLPLEEQKKLSKMNYSLFNECFTTKCFFEKYINLLNEISE